MRKFLSIVIPKFSETEKDIFPLLSSIHNQVGIDFSDLEIIIVNDGGGTGELDSNFLELFDMCIKQITLAENKGPGIARQTGLDSACGEYIMFCDADDIIHSVGVLGAFIQEAEKNADDIITSSWLEELVDDMGHYRYIQHDNENTWMHGKLFRRNFLTNNGIQFHDKLRVHEDSYFLCLAAELTERRVNLPITSYVWKYRTDSITRINNSVYTYDSFPIFIHAIILANQKLEKMTPEKMIYKIVQLILYIYFTVHSPAWKKKEHYIKEVEKATVEYLKPFMKYWENADEHFIANVYNEERNRNFPDFMESETVWGWMKRIGLNT